MASARLLYIEDDAKQREQLASSLRERGFEVATAASGEEGLERLSSVPTDLVLCDLHMPGMDGLAVLERTQSLFPELPIVLLTAHPSVPVALTAITHGAQRFLVKPVNLDEVEITVHQAIEFARLRRWQRHADEQLSQLVESAPVPYIITRLSDGEILFANSHLAKLVGLTPDEVRQRKAADFYFDDAERQKVIATLERDGFVTDLEVQIKTGDGTPIWTVFSLAKAVIGGEEVVLGGFLDITRRKRLEEKLRLYQEVFRHSVDVIAVTDQEGHILERNPAHRSKTGWTDEELAGKSVYDLIGGEKKDEIRRAIEETGSYRGEAEGLTKEGVRVPIDITIFPIHDASGSLALYVAMGRDITDIKRALHDLEEKNRELHETHAQLLQSEKMASLGSLVAGIAHEINTPVGAMTSMHDTLMRGVDKLKEHLKSKDPEAFDGDPKQVALFEVIDGANGVIREGSRRVAEIVRRLRSFARLDEAELKAVDVHEGLEDTLSLIHHEIKHHIELVREYGELPQLSVYPSRLNQVFLNLLNNARQAIADKGTITIRTGIDNGMALISITDDGAGIAPADLGKVFDPGFTTKGVGVGTGLGLSICYQILRDHHGTITVASEPSKGTTFTLRLPLNLDKILGVS